MKMIAPLLNTIFTVIYIELLMITPYIFSALLIEATDHTLLESDFAKKMLSIAVVILLMGLAWFWPIEDDEL